MVRSSALEQELQHPVLRRTKTGSLESVPGCNEKLPTFTRALLPLWLLIHAQKVKPQQYIGSGVSDTIQHDEEVKAIYQENEIIYMNRKGHLTKVNVIRKRKCY